MQSFALLKAHTRKWIDSLVNAIQMRRASIVCWLHTTFSVLSTTDYPSNRVTDYTNLFRLHNENAELGENLETHNNDTKWWRLAVIAQSAQFQHQNMLHRCWITKTTFCYLFNGVGRIVFFFSRRISNGSL